MKSYKDKQLLFGLLFLGIAGGLAGHFFETEHLSFPSANNLNQAAAILATQQNIVGASAVPTAASFSIGFSESVPTTTDIAFTETTDCTADMSIKAYADQTVGFLCLPATDTDFDPAIEAAAAKVNALVVSFDFGTKTSAAQQETFADRAIDDGAVMVVGTGPKASIDTSIYENAPIVYSLGTTGKNAKSISATAELSEKKVTNVTLIAK